MTQVSISVLVSVAHDPTLGLYMGIGSLFFILLRKCQQKREVSMGAGRDIIIGAGSNVGSGVIGATDGLLNVRSGGRIGGE